MLIFYASNRNNEIECTLSDDLKFIDIRLVCFKKQNLCSDPAMCFCYEFDDCESEDQSIVSFIGYGGYLNSIPDLNTEEWQNDIYNMMYKTGAEELKLDDIISLFHDKWKIEKPENWRYN